MSKKITGNVRTRMAPSPTGEYHIGHIRTVLYNWAFAKKNKGKFLLRIEDTDRARFVEGATERILNIISDYGFDWDEGPRVGGLYASYIQSERLEIYEKYVGELIEKEVAYYCFCTQDRLAKMRDEQKKKGVVSTKYDRKCLKLSKEDIETNLSDGVSHVVRLRVPNKRKVSFVDKVYGKITYEAKEIDDQVLLKSDGFPTYHLAVVVDDHLMKITHVMRGNDWLSSTPKHILLYEAFGWKEPVYIHLPNLKELGGTKKLSKRFGPVSAREFLDKGYLPEALVNFLMFLGWNPGTEKEIYTLKEFVIDFSIDKIHKTDLIAFDRKKLDWMNGQYIQKLSDKDFSERVKKFSPENASGEMLTKVAPLVKDRIKKLSEFTSLAGFIFQKPEVDTKLFGEDWKEHLTGALEVLGEIKKWDLKNINNALLKLIEKNNFKTGKFFMSLRIAISGSKFTPPINESVEILGKEETIDRLKEFVK